MMPLLRFAAGIAVGAIGVQLLRQAKAPEAVRSFAEKARSGLDKAGDELREATVSGLSAMEKSSAALRSKLSTAADAQQSPPPAADFAAAAPATSSASTSPADQARPNEKA